MNVPLTPLFVALISTFIGIFLLRPIANNIGLLDSPNNRKPHTGSIPVIGGIAMYLGLVVGILTTPLDLNDFSYFMLASLIVVFIGVLDDYQNISVSIRIVFQALAAFIVAELAGISILSFGDILNRGEMYIDDWPIFISVLAIIAGMNAINMLDGINGLAGGVSLIIFIAIAYLSIDSSSSVSLIIALLFCMVVPVFLIDNLCIGRPTSKRIFMGDAGSMLIGLSIAWLLIDLSQGEFAVISPVTALWLFGIPIIELVSSISRRILNGKSPFEPDLNHMHHIISHLGLGEKKSLFIMLIFSSIMAIIGIISEIYDTDEWIMFALFLLFFVFYFIFCYRFSSSDK